MTTVSVFHVADFRGFYDPAAPLIHVADVEAPDAMEPMAALEFAYRYTQNLDGSWSQGATFPDGGANRDHHPAVTVLAPLHTHEGRTYGLRSSAMGDVFQIGAHRYHVASFGFEPVTEPA